MHSFRLTFPHVLFLSFGLVLLLFFLGRGFSSEKDDRLGKPCGRGSAYTQTLLPKKSGILGGSRIAYTCEGKMRPTGVVLHYTATDSFHRTLEVLEKRGLYVQLVVDMDGKTYQVMDSLTERAAGAPGSNGWAIHIEIVGDKESLLIDAKNNGPQFQEVQRVVRFLADHYNFPLTSVPDPSKDVWRGVFSHEQIATQHPLGLDNGKTDPGQEYMDLIMGTL